MIRKSRAADITRINKLIRSTRDLVTADTKSKRVSFNKFLRSTARKHLTFVAEEGDRIVGVIIASFEPGEDHVYVEFLAVKREFRKKGIGSSLMKRCVNACRQYHIRSISLLASQRNDKLLKFYRRFGFEKDTSCCMMRMGIA